MTEDLFSVPKKTVARKRKAVSVSPDTTLPETSKTSTAEKTLKNLSYYFSELLEKIEESRTEVENLQKVIFETKENWEKEKMLNEQARAVREKDLETARKREEEEYEYEKKRERKLVEDEFRERREKWEKDLVSRKEEMEAEKKELLELRKKVADFEGVLEKAVKETQTNLTRELMGNFNAERKLREQEVKSEKEIFVLKISGLAADNSRLNQEVLDLKKAMEGATAQVKEIAVKVIESRGQQGEKTMVKSE